MNNLEALFFWLIPSALSAATLNVTNYGATGDAQWLTVNTVSNSTHVAVTNGSISSSDVGKLFLVFSGGAYTTLTNNVDLIGSVVAVSGTNVTLSVPTGGTSNGLWGMVGTENGTNIMSAIAACTTTNDTIIIPAGTYLCASSDLLDTNFVMSSEVDINAYAILLQRGGITFQGQGNATLMNCGAWQKKGSWGLRGFLFNLKHPVTNDYPLVFADLGFDGGVKTGNTGYSGFPIRVSNGDGWDETHDAVQETTGAQQHSYKEFRNCTFNHWRGEILKGTTANTTGFIFLTNCVFTDGNASAFNFTMAHIMDKCSFSNLFMVTEFYEGYSTSNSVMKNSTATNISTTCIVINGALTNRVNPAYTISNNTFHVPGNSGIGILLTPAQNVVVVSNTFRCTTGVALGGAGAQGTATISNVTVNLNNFYGVGNCVLSSATAYNVGASNNFADGGYLADGFGYCTNFVLYNNNSPNASIDGTALTSDSQWFYDDPSNVHFAFLTGDAGVTNTVFYSRGWNQKTSKTTGGASGSVYLLDDATPLKIPPLSVIAITHQGFNATLYFSSTSPSVAAPLVAGSTVKAIWNGSQWSPLVGTLAVGTLIVK